MHRGRERARPETLKISWMQGRGSGTSAGGGDSGCLAAEETFAAVYRPALRGLERHGGFATALRAHGHRLGFGETPAVGTLAFGLTTLATLRLVLEVLIMEEVLFSRGESEIRSTIHTL